MLPPKTQTVIKETNIVQTLTRAKFEELNMDLFKKTVFPQLSISLVKPTGSPENSHGTPVLPLKFNR